MKRIYKVQNKLTVLLLILAIVFSVLPAQNVMAAEVNQEETGNEAPGDNSVNEGEVEGAEDNTTETDQEEETGRSVSEENLTEGQPEEAGEALGQQDVSSSVIQYLYIENPYQVTPGVQNVAVAFQEGMSVTNAVLIYQKEGVDAQLEAAASEIQEGTVLFSIDYTDEAQSGIYQLVKVTVEADGIVHEIDLAAIGIDGRYGVNQECNTEPDAVVEEENAVSMQRSYGRSNAEATFITLDDEGELSENDAIEGTLDEALSDVSGTTVKSSREAKFAGRSSDNLVIVLDPGHGGHDSGAVGNGAKEKDLTLKIAQYCRNELQRYNGITVYMTRDSDNYVGLSDRVKYAKEMGANIFVSIHLNSSGKGTAKGAEVYYPNSSYQPELGSQGADLAQRIQNELVALGLYNRGIKIRNGDDTYSDGSVQDYYAVIRQSKLAGFPGVIIEHAFIDNASDYSQYLSSDAKLQALGQADAQGIVNYFGYGKGSWKLDNVGWKFQYLNGTYPKSKWEYIEGFWYYFGSDGYMLTGWQTIGGARYYLESSGKMKIGWLQQDGEKYYFDVTGVMHTGWLLLDGTWYYFGTGGKMLTGWQTIGGKKYLLDSKSGAMKVGWQKISGKWYYFNASGHMTTGWQWVNGKCYYMDDSGVMAEDTWIGEDYVDQSGAWVPGKKKLPVGWILDGSRWWYRHSDGSYTKSGWEDIDGKRYYFDAEGWMVTGWRWVGGKCYFLDGSGAMAKDTWIGEYYVDANGVWIPDKKRAGQWILSGNRWWYRHGDGSYTKSGWEEINGKRYYFDAEGWMVTGWQWVDGKCYYLDDTGAMKADAWIGEYYVDADGVWVPGKKKQASWKLSDGRWWYCHSDGSYTKSGWEFINSKWYYFDAEGWMETGWILLDGYYYLESSGAMHTGWLEEGGNKYYLNPKTDSNGSEGTMATGYRKIDGEWYYFNKNQQPEGALTYTGVTAIMGNSQLGEDKSAVVNKMVKRYTKQGKEYPGDALEAGGAPDIQTFCEILYDEAVLEEVKPEVVFAQAMKETGYLQYNGDVKVEQFNFAGLGATGGGVPGEKFDDVATGLRAQIQHLKAYASDEELKSECVDTRFKYIKRGSAPYVEWLGMKENPSGKGWAAAKKYGMSLMQDYLEPLYNVK